MPLDGGGPVFACREPLPLSVVVLCLVVQVVFASRCSLCPSPLTDRCSAGGPGVAPSEELLPLAAPAGGLSLGEGDGQNEQAEHKKKTMKTNTTNQDQQEGLRSNPNKSGTQQKKWNLFIGEEVYGFVHAASEAEALARVAAFKRPFRAVLAAGQE